MIETALVVLFLIGLAVIAVTAAVCAFALYFARTYRIMVRELRYREAGPQFAVVQLDGDRITCFGYFRDKPTADAWRDMEAARIPHLKYHVAGVYRPWSVIPTPSRHRFVFDERGPEIIMDPK